MQTDTLPNGFTRISGRKEPPADGPSAYFVILRNGIQPAEPWPVGKTASGQVRWKWGATESPFDIIAVKSV
jgi:hypothetical protein